MLTGVDTVGGGRTFAPPDGFQISFSIALGKENLVQNRT